MSKRLTISNTDKKVAGVCGGIAEYFEIDATLVRLAWILFIFAGGAGFIGYIIAALIMPKPSVDYGLNKSAEEMDEGYIDLDEVDQYTPSEHHDFQDNPEERKENAGKSNNTAQYVLGIILLLLGVSLLTNQFFFWNLFSLRQMASISLIAIGVVVIVKEIKNP